MKLKAETGLRFRVYPMYSVVSNHCLIVAEGK